MVRALNSVGLFSTLLRFLILMLLWLLNLSLVFKTPNFLNLTIFRCPLYQASKLVALNNYSAASPLCLASYGRKGKKSTRFVLIVTHSEQ